MNVFEDILFLFNSKVHNRKFVRLNFLEAGLLFKTARKSPGDIIEIGTKIGGSAVLLAAAAQDNNKIYSVDIIPHRSRLKGVRLDKITPKKLIGRINFIVEHSTKLAKRWRIKMGMIFIDAEHTPKALSEDIDAWKPHVMRGGYIAFHDIAVAGTKRGIKQSKQLHKVVKKKLPNWIVEGQAQSLLVLKNPE